jgi:hypothetical protein
MNPTEKAAALLVEYRTKTNANIYINDQIALAKELGVPNNTAMAYWNKVKTALKGL